MIFLLLAGGFALKKQMLDDRRFPKMHLDLQRLLQVIYQTHLVSITSKNRRKGIMLSVTQSGYLTNQLLSE